MRNFSMMVALLSMFSAQLVSAEQSFPGVELTPFQGRVPGFGVVWALRVQSADINVPFAGGDVQAGDVIITVSRFAPTIESSDDQEKMLELLKRASPGDTYTVVRLRDDKASATGFDRAELRFVVPYDTGTFVTSNVWLQQIYTQDWSRALGRERGDPDEIRGKRSAVNIMTLAYHSNFGRLCDLSDFGGFVDITTTVETKRSNQFTGVIYSETSTEYTIRVSRDAMGIYKDAEQWVGFSDWFFRGNLMADLAVDADHLIRENGCTSRDLRQFESRLETARQMANR